MEARSLFDAVLTFDRGLSEAVDLSRSRMLVRVVSLCILHCTPLPHNSHATGKVHDLRLVSDEKRPESEEYAILGWAVARLLSQLLLDIHLVM